MKPTRHRKAAYTVIELLIVASLAMTLAGLAFTPASSVDGSESSAAGQLFSRMIEYGQSMAIARPDVIYLIKVNQAQNQFWLANATAPDTPLTHPITKQPYRVTVGKNSPDGLTAVTISAYSLGGDDVVKFDSSGALDQNTPASISFTAGGVSQTSSAEPLTGVVRAMAADATPTKLVKE